MRCVRLPRGAAWISISLSSGSASFASRTSHSPPPNSVWNTVRKFSRTLPNDSRNSALAVWSISRAACCNEWRAATRSSRCVIRNSSRFVSSACSSTASAFTGPTPSPPPRAAPPRRRPFPRAQPPRAPRHFGSVGEQLVERLAPLGLDLRHETAPAAENLGPLELELVLFGAPGLERGAGGFECGLRPGESRVRLSHLRFGVARGGLERAHRERK